MPCKNLCQAALLLACLAPATLLSADENWPQFRGAESLGFPRGGNTPVQWSATENVEWKTDLTGRGWSSPIVWGDKIFLSTVVPLGEVEEPRKGLYFGGDRPTPSSAEHQWKVQCLDLKTGRQLWEQVVHQAKPATSIHLKNSYASETPVTDGQRLYVYFGNVGIFCFDLSGNPIWSQKLDPHATRLGWGTASSPVLYEGRLYVVNDNDEESFLLALDAKTGAELMRIKRDEKTNWATPYVWKNSQRTELVTPGTGRNRSYDLNGNLLWEFKGMSSITIATPFSKDDLLYISSGYVNDRLKPVYAVRPGASGDITLAADQTSNDYIAWCHKTAGPYNPTSLLYKDLLYVLYDQGFFACYDPKTGDEIYGKQRIPEGRAFTASPWGVGDKVYCLNEDGVTFVMATGKNFEIVDTLKLADDDMCMATPAFVGDRMLIRTASRIYCIKNGAKPAG